MLSTPLTLQKPENNVPIDKYPQVPEKVVELRRQNISVKSSQCSRNNDQGNHRSKK